MDVYARTQYLMVPRARDDEQQRYVSNKGDHTPTHNPSNTIAARACAHVHGHARALERTLVRTLVRTYTLASKGASWSAVLC